MTNARITRAITLVAATLSIGLFGLANVAADQTPPDVAFPATNMTRQQVMDKLTSAAPGTTVVTAKGKEVFDKLCASCHILGETGTSVGPDLTTLSSRFGRREVLDSILWPSRTISDQYAVTVLELTDGSYRNGVVVREDRQAVYLKNSDHLDRPLPVLLSQIKERTESPISLMPENLVAALTLDEIDSLVAFTLSAK
jgi:putative heme-binding domain-containing protein